MSLHFLPFCCLITLKHVYIFLPCIHTFFNLRMTAQVDYPDRTLVLCPLFLAMEALLYLKFFSYVWNFFNVLYMSSHWPCNTWTANWWTNCDLHCHWLIVRVGVFFCHLCIGHYVTSSYSFLCSLDLHVMHIFCKLNPCFLFLCTAKV